MNVDTRLQAYGMWDKNRRDTLVHEALPMVYALAKRIVTAAYGSTLETGDLINSGVVALYSALDRFDEGRGVSFSTYASHYVRGQMLAEIRRNRQIPAGLRDKQVKIQNAYDSLAQGLMRQPTDEEVAAHLGISVDRLGEWLADLGWLTVWSLDELEESGVSMPQDDREDIHPARSADAQETKRLLAQAIGRLTQKEQFVLFAVYEEELSLKDVALVMDLSESQISRIHSKAVLRLRGMLSRKKQDMVSKT